MNWPRYVKPAGICPGERLSCVIACAIFSRLGLPSCLPAPFGPSRENRNGGGAAGGAAVARERRKRYDSRPPRASPSNPSPMTK